MSNNKWIIVSSKIGSRFYEYKGPEKGLQLVKSIDNPEAKLKNSDIDSDKPGSGQSGSTHGSMNPEVDAKTKLVERFAKEVAVELEKGRKANEYGRLVMVAEPGFMGQVLGNMDNKTSDLIFHKLNKDLFNHKPEDVLKSLNGVL